MITKIQGLDTSDSLVHTLTNKLPIEVTFSDGAKTVLTEYEFFLLNDGGVQLITTYSRGSQNDNLK